MKRLRGIHYLLCFVLFAGVLGLLSGNQVAFAIQQNTTGYSPLPPSQEEPPPEETHEEIELVSRFPVKQGESDTSFEFEVSLNYQGTDPKVFQFSLVAPPGWQASVKRPFTETESNESLLAITLQPNQSYPERVKIILSPLPGNHPEPGNYILTFGASSGDLQDSIELKAVVTGTPLTYELDFITANGRLDFPVKAGEDNPIPLRLTNSGSGVLTNLSFTSVKSEGWGTTFAPSKIESLEPGESVEAEVTITPPRKTIAGDYRVLVRAGANSPDMRLQEQLDLRIRVETPSVWGGAGIGIVVAVIAGLAIMFRRLGRR